MVVIQKGVITSLVSKQVCMHAFMYGLLLFWLILLLFIFFFIVSSRTKLPSMNSCGFHRGALYVYLEVQGSYNQAIAVLTSQIDTPLSRVGQLIFEL